MTERELLLLTNPAKRQAFLETWPAWPLWGEMPDLGVKVYRADLANGHVITAAEYEAFSGNYDHRHALFNYIKSGGKFTPHSETVNQLCEKLKEWRMEILMKERKD